MRNKFDNIMDYIEDNLIKTNTEIEKGIAEILNIEMKKFKTFFEILTNSTLANYINGRRFNAIAVDLINDVNVIELVSFYGYSEQSAFSRAIKNYYGVTPNEIRKNKNIPILPKLYFEDFYNDSIKKIRDELYDNFTIDDEFFSYDITDFIDPFFDIDECLEIFKLSNKLKIDYRILKEKCIDRKIDTFSREEYYYGIIKNEF